MNKALTIIGGGPFIPGEGSSGAPITSSGGDGGSGGQAGVTNSFIQGGAGGAGGVAGKITVGFDGVFVPGPASGPGPNPELASNGLVVGSEAGQGGRGGDSSHWGIAAKQAGNGGPGGLGGPVTVVASGSVRVEVRGVLARSIGGSGGDGGKATSFDKLDTTTGGDGGDGGTAGTVSAQWLSGTIETSKSGLMADALGGFGGDGGVSAFALGTGGGNGGIGGNGGPATALFSGGGITVNLNSGLPVSGSGVQVTANGNFGGKGGAADFGVSAVGGSGGKGGDGGAASATILGTVTLNGSAGFGQIGPQVISQGVLVQANGGGGGNGANARALVGQAGGGGFAGAGGSATLTLGNAATPGTIRTSGNFAHGALVQSVGGAGGNGGQANFNTVGGGGAAGGNGGAVLVDAPNGSVIVTGNNSSALLAQSVGGGGGTGGDTHSIAIGFDVSIGGNGGLGGNGSTVRVNLAQGVFASTSLLGGAGILAQSIGGSGGSGGSATSVGSALFAMTIGGDAGGGGSGGPVNVTNGALITTYGDHAAGVQAQSIGGGGGKGGSATTFNVGVVAAAAVAIGGRGGGGGPAGDVSVTNTGQVATYGADATGVLIQSIGGGGGAAAARAIAVSPDPKVPAISLAVAIGGKGGAGNTGGTANLNNSGLITTAGDGAIAVIAQSIGGGGGMGGDSTAASYSGGTTADGVNISVAVAVGGSGGTGGTGGGVVVGNRGVIATLGQDAYGVFAQSVGGGGGTGGAGDASASSDKGKVSFGAAVAVSGTGGTGGHGGTVSMTNSGAVTTRGDGADGVFAQSVGGGGGGVAHAGGGTLSIAVGVGGSGGAGGDGNTATVTVTNSGSVVTRGTDAIGMSVQSVGGGGGKGGKGGATAGGAAFFSNTKALFDVLAGGLGFGQQVTTIGDGILQVGHIGEEIDATYDELNGIFSQPQAGAAAAGSGVKINVSVSVGGSGGAAGHGGAANATNTGAIGTYGAQSDGIYAQSVGGGGGSGGAATSASAAADDTPVQTAVAVGGRGGGGGNGGPVTVVNGTGGTILTQGVAAFGIFAQSVGGGGGEGSVAGSVSGSLKSLSVGVGGNGGKGGDGGTVSVTTGDGTLTGSTIATTGKNGIGIFAQSIGGGGGLVRTMTTDQTFDPSKILINPQGRAADIQGISLTLGGQNGSGGKGGDVGVVTNGVIGTSGRDAHGILAQSIGGGGGIAVGGQVHLPVDGTGGKSGASGDGGGVTLRLQPGSGIITIGDGAYGILAQSIGGGGGVGGDLSDVTHYAKNPGFAMMSGTGNGGAVSIATDFTGISTTGRYAPAIFAQSIGGGGGLMNYYVNFEGPAKNQTRGTAGGDGDGGAVTVSLVRSVVSAGGEGSAGVLAQSAGKSSGPIRVSIDKLSVVRGGRPDPLFSLRDDNDAAAIRLLGGTANQINNAGLIEAAGDPKTALAILTDTTSSHTAVDNTGTIAGNIVFGTSGSNLVENRAGGVINAPATIDLGGGVLRNAGTLHVGGIGTIGTTTLTGNLVQSATGTVRIDMDARNGRADLLQVSGTATLDGTVAVNFVGVRRGTTGPVLTAAGGIIVPGGITTAPLLQGLSTPVFSQTAVVTGNSLAIATNADFRSNDPAASASQRSAAAHLQQIWDRGDTAFDQGFETLATLKTRNSYVQALDALSGKEVAAVASARFEAGQNFAREAFGCSTSADNTTIRLGSHCVWARTVGVVIDNDASKDFPAYKWQAGSVKVGGQAEIRPNLEVAASLGYESGRLNASGGNVRASSDTGLALAGLRYSTGPWTFDGVLDFAFGGLTTKRTIAEAGFATASGTSRVFSTGLHLRAAYIVPLGGIYIEPALELDASYVRIGGYTESGATPFNLKVNTLQDVVLAATPGARVGSKFQLGPNAAANIYAGAGVSFLSGNDFEVDARFASVSSAAGGFRSAFSNDSVVGRFTAGVDIQTVAGISVSLQYQGRRSSNQAEHGGQARLAYRF